MADPWQDTREHWRRQGVQPFVNGEVPYFVTNNGRLSEDTAQVYFANCREHPPAGPHTILELGAGTGLFARFFLDAFRDLCRAESVPFYDSLTYVVTDASEATCRYWAECGIFDAHAERVLIQAADAASIELPPVRAVVANYILDSLPAAILRRAGDGWQALNLDGVQWQTAADYAEWTGLAGESTRVAVNHGAGDLLMRCVQYLDPDGFILVNDYSAVTAGETAPQDYGGATALGLNFPLLTKWLEARGVRVTCPPGDEDRILHSRLLSRRPLELTQTCFNIRFTTPDAERQPRNWVRMAEAADSMCHEQRDFAGALELARAAVDLNPWYSPWLWNVYGDCLYELGRLGEAVEAYHRAAWLSPGDPRTNLNLAYFYREAGNFEEALAAVARGLANDEAGYYRDRLLSQQNAVLEAIANRWAADLEAKARRSASILS
jgi:tetratricopeptide (TPR) repeat protein